LGRAETTKGAEKGNGCREMPTGRSEQRKHKDKEKKKKKKKSQNRKQGSVER
jgi:hypothetical protein